MPDREADRNNGDEELQTRVSRQQSRRFATIEKAKGGSVPALLWEISPQDEAALDRWIGVPELYRSTANKVRRDGTLVDALIYILNSGKPQNKPSAFYYSTLLEGYKAAGFDTMILKTAVQKGDPDASGA